MALFDRAFEKRELKDPSILRTVFGNTALAPLWLVARLYLGYQWLLAGWPKLYGDERWIARDGPDGLALKGFWERAIAIPEKGRPPIAYDWYRDFLNFSLGVEGGVQFNPPGHVPGTPETGWGVQVLPDPGDLVHR